MEMEQEQNNYKDNSIYMMIGWLLHGEFLQMTYVEYCNTYRERQRKAMELKRFFDTVE